MPGWARERSWRWRWAPRLARLAVGRQRRAASIARLLQRGGRSGIGIGAFEQGGFILDGGRGADDAATAGNRAAGLPGRWRILLVFDLDGEGCTAPVRTGRFGNCRHTRRRLPAVCAVWW